MEEFHCRSCSLLLSIKIARGVFEKLKKKKLKKKTGIKYTEKIKSGFITSSIVNRNKKDISSF